MKAKNPLRLSRIHYEGREGATGLLSSSSWRRDVAVLEPMPDFKRPGVRGRDCLPCPARFRRGHSALLPDASASFASAIDVARPM